MQPAPSKPCFTLIGYVKPWCKILYHLCIVLVK